MTPPPGSTLAPLSSPAMGTAPRRVRLESFSAFVRRPQSANAAALVVARVAGLLIPLISLPLLARGLSASGLGQLAFVQAVALYLCMIIDFGFNQSAITSAAKARDRATLLREIYWSITAFRALLLALCLGILALLAMLVAHSPLERSVYLLASLNLAGVYMTPPWLYQGVDRGAIYALGLLVPRLAQPLLIWLLVRTPGDVTVATVILFGTDLVAGFGLALYAIMRIVPGRPNPRMATMRREAGQAVDAWIVSLAGALTAAIGPIALRLTVGLAAVGAYSVADKIVRGVVGCFLPVAQSFQGEASRLVESDSSGLHQLSRRITMLLESGALVFVLVTLLFARPIVVGLFGPSFESAAGILRAYVLLTIPAALSAVLGSYYFIARRRTKDYRAVYIAAALVNVMLVLLLGRLAGAVGVAWAASATEWLIVGALLLVLRAQRRDVQPGGTIDEHARPR
jgi:polysaccharide transporter, PST family